MKHLFTTVLLYLIILLSKHVFSKSKKPHIIVIIADDMGLNDAGYSGSNQIRTPNIDALAYNGIILHKHYTQMTCTPSRAALLTGNYPIRSGMQGYPLKSGENRSLPLDMLTMPEQMKKLGYKTHLVGKWHLGAAYGKTTPTRRGFDTHFGYWNGFLGYFNYTNYVKLPDGSMYYGMDLHDELRPVWEIQNKYTTDLFTEKTIEIIEGHDESKPLFVILSHLAPHTGWDGDELGVVNKTATDINYHYIKDPKRRLYADVVNSMDKSIGQVVEKLADKDMLKNSIILFLSDNGAQTVGMFANSGSNWPLRGVKFSDFEGGIRTAAVIFSPLFRQRGYVSKELIHLTDWLPTFYAAAGGNVEDLGVIDGINQWKTLANNVPSNRTEILININEVENTEGIITDRGRYKLLTGTYEKGFYDKYYGESGRGNEVPSYDYDAIYNSATHQAIKKIMISNLTNNKIDHMRSTSDLSWCRSEQDTPEINCVQGCLFDLKHDPCETTNIIEKKSKKAQELYRKLQKFRKQLVPQTNKNAALDSNPSFYNGTWCTWLDDQQCFKTKKTESTY